MPRVDNPIMPMRLGPGAERYGPLAQQPHKRLPSRVRFGFPANLLYGC